MKKPKIATVEKPAPKVKTEQPVATVVTEAKPKMPAAQKSSNKPKAVTPKPVPEAKAEQPVVSLAAEAKPKKASATQKSPKKAKAVAPKGITTATEIANPERESLPFVNIWPKWVENLLGSFGIKKK